MTYFGTNGLNYQKTPEVQLSQSIILNLKKLIKNDCLYGRGFSITDVALGTQFLPHT